MATKAQADKARFDNLVPVGARELSKKKLKMEPKIFEYIVIGEPPVPVEQNVQVSKAKI